MSKQRVIVRLNALVPTQHPYRRLAALGSFDETEPYLKRVETANPHKGYGMRTLFKCLLWQFREALSDRALARYIQENTAAKWCYGFSRTQKPPHGMHLG